ncbi:hypothetical protein [Nitrobacter sp.]|uniref:hypothetical protein n=1 Tax=Nitrobacter sp. TaxID=29420 RepID=UPI00399D640F
MDLDKSTEAYELAFEAMTRFATIAKLTEAFPRGAGREPLQGSSTNTMMRHHRWRAILRSDDVAHAFSAYYDGAVGLLVANALSGITQGGCRQR